MAFDDPVVWILIVALVVFLFGSNKIPDIARAMGQARREFEKGMRGIPPGVTHNVGITPTESSPIPSSDDPLVKAAESEGIDTHGKTRDQIASELAWKLNKK
jgi:sec-independent protein translocase protein TatA